MRDSRLQRDDHNRSSSAGGGELESERLTAVAKPLAGAYLFRSYGLESETFFLLDLALLGWAMVRWQPQSTVPPSNNGSAGLTR